MLINFLCSMREQIIPGISKSLRQMTQKYGQEDFLNSFNTLMIAQNKK